jgi:hypothetical protein
MPERTKLTGGYTIVNRALLGEKLKLDDDPRLPFYRAILAHTHYEAYLGEVGDLKVEVEGYKANPISGRMEILYYRRNGWIEDS